MVFVMITPTRTRWHHGVPATSGGPHKSINQNQDNDFQVSGTVVKSWESGRIEEECWGPPLSATVSMWRQLNWKMTEPRHDINFDKTWQQLRSFVTPSRLRVLLSQEPLSHCFVALPCKTWPFTEEGERTSLQMFRYQRFKSASLAEYQIKQAAVEARWRLPPGNRRSYQGIKPGSFIGLFAATFFQWWNSVLIFYKCTYWAHFPYLTLLSTHLCTYFSCFVNFYQF